MTVAESLKTGRVRAVRRSEGVTVPTTGVQVLGPNPNRVAYLVSNLDASNFAVVADRPIGAATAGARLNAAGGNYRADFEELGMSVGDPLFAAFDTAQGTLHVTEWEAY